MIIWLLVGYMWLVLYRPFERWEFLGGLHADVIHAVTFYTLFLVVVWLLGLISEGKRPLGNIFSLGLILYTFAIILSTLVSPYTDIFTNWVFRNWLSHVAFFIILMTSLKTERDLKIITTCYIVIIFLSTAETYLEFLGGQTRTTGRVERIAVAIGDRILGLNFYSTTLACTLPLTIPLLALCKKPWHYLFALGHILLVARVVLQTGSRTALVLLVLAMLLSVLFSRRRLVLIPLMLLGGAVGWAIVPENMQQRYLTIIAPEGREHLTYEGGRGTEDRLMHHLNRTLERLPNYPVFGAGPGRNAPAAGERMAIHMLYGQIPTDLGIIGSIAFLFMLSCFGINHYSIWKNYKYLQEKRLGEVGRYCWYVSIGVIFAVIMMLVQGLGLHTGYEYTWIWFGAFQALAAMIMQEKVLDAMQGKLVPKLLPK